MIKLMDIYRSLPITLQNIACSLEGWRVKHQRRGGAFPRLLAEAEDRASWSDSDMQAYRDKRLRSFIEHVANTVPYYQRKFTEWSVAPSDIRTLEDLKRLPILTKRESQDNHQAMISDAVPPGKRIMAHTSGTTGGGLKFVTTRSALQERWAIWWRYRRWHGIHLDTWCAYFGGQSIVPRSQESPPYWRYDYPGRRILFSGYHMAPYALGAYVEELRRRQPPWLHGYPSSLSLLGGYLIDTEEALGYSVRWVTTGAENLLPGQAELIERAFGVRPRQHYGTAEGAANFSECEKGNLHVDEDFSAVEFLPNPDGPGLRVVGTAFLNPATTFLRYDVGDIVTLSEKGCPCGRPGRIVESIDGRKEDYVILDDGTRIGRLDHIFKDMVTIRESQIVQRQPGAVIFRIVRGRGYGESDEEHLLQEARKRLGSNMDIRINYVDNLPRSDNGKLRFVISEIESAQV
jgi:phenylacetate-CoA ligase